jgi:hypothetical protein
MPEAFERERKKPGRRVRTVTKGPDKGKLIAVGGEHPVLGAKRGHKRKGKAKAKDFEGFM